MNARAYLSALAAATMILAAGSALAGTDVVTPELQAVLQAAAPQEEIPVIISFADRVDPARFNDPDRRQRRARMLAALKEKSDKAHKPLKAFLERRRARHMRVLWLKNALAAHVPADSIPEIAHWPGVSRIQTDGVLQAPPVTYDSSVTPEWNLQMVRAPDLWSLGFTGQGVVVANMDTGVDANHPDLAVQWRGGNNSWFDPNGQHSTPYDRSGHGTQTMGVMVGRNSGGTAIGVAPNAQWIAVKIFNDAGSATYSGIHSGFQWLLDPDGNPATDDAPDVVNNSWSLVNVYQCNLEFEDDIGALRAAGIAVVFAAGNSGSFGAFSTESPANNPSGYGVGAVDSAQTVASFSGRGPSTCTGNIDPDVVAPGESIYTSDLSLGGLPLYATVSGTSFASPHVAGTMALLLSAFPQLTVTELESTLQQSAVDLGATGADNDYGNGLINAWWAYNLVRTQNADTDGDTVPDYRDNCTQVANANQRDTDGDGFGNMCDGDLNNDIKVNVVDLNLFKAAYNTVTGNPAYNPNADFNGDGRINTLDLSIFKLLYSKPPGPSCCGP